MTFGEPAMNKSVSGIQGRDEIFKNKQINL